MIDERIDKILILTNPMTYLFFLVTVIIWLFDLIFRKSQFKNLFFYLFKIKNKNESELKQVVKWCEFKLKDNPTKWDKYVINLNYKKAKELL